MADESLGVLLLLLVVNFFLLPPAMPWVREFVVDVVFTLILVTGVAAMARSRLALVLSTVLVLVTLALGWSGAASTGGLPRIAETAASLATFVLFALLVLYRTLSPGPMNRHRLLGAVAAYLLIGMACALGYELFELLEPGALEILTTAEPHEMRRQLGYFSLVTLTTVGYGDITPVSQGARSLATFEGLLGQLYPAIIIGWMVASLPGRKD